MDYHAFSRCILSKFPLLCLARKILHVLLVDEFIELDTLFASTCGRDVRDISFYTCDIHMAETRSELRATWSLWEISFADSGRRTGHGNSGTQGWKEPLFLESSYNRNLASLEMYGFYQASYDLLK